MADFSVMINLGKADLDDYSLLAKMLHKTGFSETKARFVQILQREREPDRSERESAEVGEERFVEGDGACVGMLRRE